MHLCQYMSIGARMEDEAGKADVPEIREADQAAILESENEAYQIGRAHV